MGGGSSKSAKSATENQPKDDNKTITICVFGLDDAGKTSIIKAIDGDPTDNVSPTVNSKTIVITKPFSEKNGRNDKNKNQQRIQIIDVSGEKRFRQQSWSQYYDQIHGFIFVIDASDKRRVGESQESLEDLLEHEKLRDKPMLILANKQDQDRAIDNEQDLKRKLNIERLKSKHKIELCTALPRDRRKGVDESIGEGFSWLIRTINDNYTALNARVAKTKDTRNNKQSNRFESDQKEKTTDYRSKITSEKLPSINMNRNKSKAYTDDDDDDDDKDDHNYTSSSNGSNKKKKVVGAANTTSSSVKKLRDNEPKAFRATYESFPEETPWSISSSGLRPMKSDDPLSRLHTKSSLTGDIKRRDVSPLVRDTKSYTTGSLSKRDNHSDEDNEENYNRSLNSKSTSRFDTSPFPASRFASNTKKPTSSIYDDGYGSTNNRSTSLTTRKPYDRDDDDDENNYSKSSATNKTNANYDPYDSKNHSRFADRSNLNSDYQRAASKSANRSTYDDDDYSSSKPKTRFAYNNDYSTSKSTTHSKHDDDDDDDDDGHRRSSSRAGAKHDDDDDDDYPSSKVTTRSRYNTDDRPFSSSKPTSVTKSTGYSKYDDDDDDDKYSSSTKKNPSSSSYNNYSSGNGSRTRLGDNTAYPTRNEPINTNQYRKNTYYDD